MPVLKFPRDYIDKFDRHGMLRHIEGIPRHLAKGYELARDVGFKHSFSSIILTGMGGSSIGSQVVKSMLKNSKTPIFVNREYHLPRVAAKDSLVVGVSYSGDAEETVSACREALRIGCELVLVSTGGKLDEMSRVYKVPMVRLPSGLPQRSSIGYQLGALLGILEKAGLLRGVASEVRKTESALKKDLFTEPALKLSEKLVGKIPMIYASELFYPVAYRWKSQFNENSKVLAFANRFSELNHNELQGYLGSRAQGKFHMVILKSQDDSPRLQKRMTLTRDTAQEHGLDVTEIGIRGNSLLTRLASGILIGDLASYYLGLRYEVDPTNIPDIERFKGKLGPYI